MKVGKKYRYRHYAHSISPVVYEVVHVTPAGAFVEFVVENNRAVGAIPTTSFDLYEEVIEPPPQIKVRVVVGVYLPNGRHVCESITEGGGNYGQFSDPQWPLTWRSQPRLFRILSDTIIEVEPQ